MQTLPENLSVDLFRRNRVARFQVSKAFVDIRLRPRQIGAELALHEFVFVNESFYGLFERSETSLGDLGLEPFFRYRVSDECSWRPLACATDALKADLPKRLYHSQAHPVHEFPVPASAFDRGRNDPGDIPADERGALMSSHTAAWMAGSRTMPFLRCRRPASNCGLISATSHGAGQQAVERAAAPA